MKNILNLILILSQILWTTPSHAALTEPDKAIIAHVNLLSNPGLENGKAGQTATTGVLTIDTTNYLEGKQSGLMTFSSATGDVQASAATTQMSGMNVYASCKVKTSATSIQFCGTSNGVETSCVSVPSNNTWSPVGINFIGPTNGQSIGYKIKNTSAVGSVTFNYDGCDLGIGSVNTVSQAVLVGTAKVTGCASAWSVTASSFTDFGTQTGCTYTTTGGLSAPGTNLAGFKVASLPAGDYTIVYEGQINPATNVGAVYRFNDGTNPAREESTFAQGQGSSGINASFSYTTDQTNVTFKTQGKVPSGTIFIYGTTTAPGVFRLYYNPPSTSQVINPSVTPASWSGYHTISGAWSTASTTIGDVSNGSGIALTQLTNRNFGSVTTASGSLPGITFTPPRTGHYRICGTPSVNNSTSNQSVSARLVDGSNAEIAHQRTATSGTNGAQSVIPLCGNYLVSSLTPMTAKIQIGVNQGGTGTASISTYSGDAAIQWDIIELDAALPSPVFTSNKYIVSYQDTTGLTYTAGDRVQYNSQLYDNTGGAVTTGSSWLFQPNHAGYYRVNVAVYAASGSQELFVYKNATSFKYVASFNAGTNVIRGSGTAIVFMNGSTDSLYIRSSPGLSNWTANSVGSTVAATNYIDIQEL